MKNTCICTLLTCMSLSSHSFPNGQVLCPFGNLVNVNSGGMMASQEKTEEKVALVAKSFLISIGVKVAGSDKPNVRKTYESDTALSYSVTYPYCHVAVDAITNTVFLYNNSKYESATTTPKAPPTKLMIKDPINARAYISRYMERLKIPSEYKLVSMSDNIKDFVPGNPRSSTIFVKATYSPEKYGYSLDTLDYYMLRLDCENGELIEYMRFYRGPFVIESHELKLSGDEALAKAQEYAKKLGINMSFNRNTKREVRYVIPNSFIREFKASPVKKPEKIRLAWEFFVSAGEVIWIDAKDGRLLGGFWLEKG